MRAPEFWYRRNRNWQSYMLQPAAWLYQCGYHLQRVTTTPKRFEVPVICVGNLVAGGAGKTPTVALLAQCLKDSGIDVHIVSRGYGGNIKLPTRVTTQHTHPDVGDETLLLARHAPCWVGANRRDTVQAAIDQGATCVLLDDGFQNPSITKDYSFIIVDGASGFGNGATLPAGPLRESLTAGLQRADSVLIIGDDMHRIKEKLPTHLTIYHYNIQPDVPDNVRNTPLVAFCGIGRPEKFYTTCRNAGLQLAATKSFADHHPYSDEDMAALQHLAVQHLARLITTEKDYVKISDQYRSATSVLPITLTSKTGDNSDLIAPLLEQLDFSR